MNNDTPNTQKVSLDDVVAEAINLDYVPPGCTVLEMTSAFLEEAEVDYENAKIAGESGHKFEALKARAQTCKARHELALSIYGGISSELKTPDTSDLRTVDGFVTPHFEPILVGAWLEDRYGISTPRWNNKPRAADDAGNNEPPLNPDTKWEDITIKIYEDYRIGFRAFRSKYKNSSFLEIGLIDLRNLQPNELGGILLGLAKGKKYPPNVTVTPANKTAISKLRNALRRLTGLTGDPFYEVNAGDGWKPIFTLVDDRNNAAERAKKTAKHVSYDEQRDTPDFEIEDDENDKGGKWLKENDT